MATHSSILAWEIPQREEPAGLQSPGSQRVGHDLATKSQQQVCVLRMWFFEVELIYSVMGFRCAAVM